jgi:DNA/RNA-binding domain of Phe-tRNA-synthetase-like protein
VTTHESGLRIEVDLPDLLVGWVRADGVQMGDAPAELAQRLDDLIADPSRWGLTDDVRVGIRDLLRGHGYKPAGRGKPASEFLVRAASTGEFPRINNLVDINNLISLETGWPISILDCDRAATDTFVLRHGQAEESYVFNAAGHEIGLGGLLLVAADDGRPLGNPVKDSMAAKLTDDTTRVVVVIYSSARVADAERVAAAAAEFGELIRVHGRAEAVASGVISAES